MSDEKKHQIASPDGAISFLFCIFAIMNGYSNQFAISNNALFSIGAVQSLISVFAIIAALINMIRGKARGNVNLLATMLLGLFPGLIKLIRVLALGFNVRYDPYIFGIIYIIGSLFVFTIAWKRRNKPLYRFIGTVGLSLAFLFDGVGMFFHMHVLVWISGLFYYLFAVEMYYFGLTIMYFYYDARLPQGPRWKGKQS